MPEQQNLPRLYAYAQPGETPLSWPSASAKTHAIAALNSLPETARLFPGQPVRIPVAHASPDSGAFGAVLNVSRPGSLVQGRTGRVVVDTKRPLDLSADWNGLPIAFTPQEGNPLRQFAFLPVPALLEPVSYPLTIAYPAANGVSLRRTWPVAVVEGDYERQEINLPPDRGVLLAPEIVQEELALVTAVWSQVSPTLLWTEPFSRPIDLEYPTTSPFDAAQLRRALQRYHQRRTGADGVVTVPADGIVAVEPLNARQRRHPPRLASYRLLASGRNRADIQPVAAGDVVGLVGNTGLSTAHLLNCASALRSIHAISKSRSAHNSGSRRGPSKRRRPGTDRRLFSCPYMQGQKRRAPIFLRP